MQRLADHNLQDRALDQMSLDDWNAAVIPKVPGTWNLHECLKDMKLDFFVLFSSGSGIIGQAGQANYASANTFLDAFVQYRQSLGLPASVLDIGVVEDIGYVSENPQILESLRAAALWLLSERDILESLQIIIARSALPAPLSKPTRTEAYTNPGQVVLGLRTTMPLADPNNRTVWKRDPRMGAYRDSESLTMSQSSGTDESLKRLLAAVATDPGKLDTNECVDFLAKQIKDRILGFLMTPDGDIDLGATLNEVGIDSLVAIELRNWWGSNLGTEISVLELLNATIKQLAQLAVEKLKENIQGKPANGKTEHHPVDADAEDGKAKGEQYLPMKA